MHITGGGSSIKKFGPPAVSAIQSEQGGGMVVAFFFCLKAAPCYGKKMATTKGRILHVDDPQDPRLLMSALLTDCGYGVMTAGSVTEALQLAAEIPVDLYLLNIRLPDGTGIQLCQKLREPHPRAPVIHFPAFRV